MSGRICKRFLLAALLLVGAGLTAQTQSQMNQGACAQYQKTDQLLTRT
jgi:hypothetical protein